MAADVLQLISYMLANVSDLPTLQTSTPQPDASSTNFQC